MPVVLKPDVPQPTYPPPERLVFGATPLQAHLIRQHVESGYGEGVNRLHSRLSKQFAGMIHPGMDTTRPADDPENFQRDPATGRAVLEANLVYDANCQYVAGGIRYQIPCQAEYDVKLDANNRPISLSRRQPRLSTSSSTPGSSRASSARR